MKNYQEGVMWGTPLWVVAFVICFALAFINNAPVWVYVVIIIVAVPVVLYLQDRSDKKTK